MPCISKDREFYFSGGEKGGKGGGDQTRPAGKAARIEVAFRLQFSLVQADR